jgi:hypothetical protein
MRNYVYALIDPTRQNQPFYIGKGMDNRLQSHFIAASNLSTKQGPEVIGRDTRSVLEEASQDRLTEKLARIFELRKQGFDHTKVARIVGRRLDEHTAFAIEAFLINSVYGVRNLTNQVLGAHSERFRPFGIHGLIKGFDFEGTGSDVQVRALEQKFGRYYVYTLRDPETNRVFYVGKGSGLRMFAHFADAAGTKPIDETQGHLRILRKLLDAGHTPQTIGRVEARLQHEQQAFAIEALLMKFVYGFNSVGNRVAGHHGEMFRAKDDWEVRRGFDHPYVSDPGKMMDRADKRDGMIGEGLAIPLLAVAANFPELNFDLPKILNSGELGIQADLIPAIGGAGTRVKIFIRRRDIQVELRGKSVLQKQWIVSHFAKLGATGLRGDTVYLPKKWKNENMTDDLDEIVNRVRIMRQIVNATGLDALTSEIRELLTHL